MKVHNTSHRQSIKSLNVNTALQRTFEMSKHIVVYEVLAALRKAPPPDPNATPQQYENALKDLEGKWEEELEKNAEFSDIEAFAKSKEALDQILKVDLSKLDSAEMRALNDAFVKILENEKKCMEKRCGHNATNEYKCEYCPRSFLWKNSRDKHVQTCHPTLPPMKVR